MFNQPSSKRNAKDFSKESNADSNTKLGLKPNTPSWIREAMIGHLSGTMSNLSKSGIQKMLKPGETFDSFFDSYRVKTQVEEVQNRNAIDFSKESNVDANTRFGLKPNTPSWIREAMIGQASGTVASDIKLKLLQKLKPNQEPEEFFKQFQLK